MQFGEFNHLSSKNIFIVGKITIDLPPFRLSLLITCSNKISGAYTDLRWF